MYTYHAQLSIPCGLGCSGGRRPETFPFTPVRLLLLNLHPRFNFSLWRPCSSGLLLPTAEGDKRRIEINGMAAVLKIVYLIWLLEAKLYANFNWGIWTCKYSTGKYILCAEVKSTRSVFLTPDISQAWQKSGLETKSDLNLKQKLKITTSSSASVTEQTTCFRLFGWSIFNLWGSGFVRLNQEMFPEKQLWHIRHAHMCRQWQTALKSSVSEVEK